MYELNINYGNINDGKVRNIEMYLLIIKKIYMILVVEGYKREECIRKYQICIKTIKCWCSCNSIVDEFNEFM